MKNNDVFANMAEIEVAQSRQLVSNPVPPRPEKILPLRPAENHLRLLAKPDENVEYQRGMQALRHWAVPFLNNCAPLAKEVRGRINLKRFQWRMEADEDLHDSRRPLIGEGSWKRVTIPHYGGPIGRATAYYRCEFSLTEQQIKNRSLSVCFKGVDYKAHVFVNDRFMGSHEGFFSPFELDFTPVARRGRNTLLIRVENDQTMMSNVSWGDDLDGDKIYAATGPGWDNSDRGWCHCPPGMGLYQPVSIESRAPVHVQNIFVRPLPSLHEAELRLEINQARNQRDIFSVAVSVHGLNFKATALKRRVMADKLPADPGVNYFCFKLNLPNVRSWSTDAPWLYQVQVDLLDTDGRVMDRLSGEFGMRSFSMETQQKPFGRVYLNGSEIKLRGTNTMGFEQQDVMQGRDEQLLEDLLMVKCCGMNYLRLTQRPVQEEIYRMCNRLGLMTQTDLPLFGLLRRNQFAEAVRQAGEMERMVRSHPCNIMVTFINEPFPPALRKKEHRHLARPELESFFDAAARLVLLHNPDRVIKPTEGDYEPPAVGLPDTHCYNLWYNGHEVPFGTLYRGGWCAVKEGWQYGCGEFGAEGLDPAELMMRRYPKEWLPKKGNEETWTPLSIKRAQTGQFYGFFCDRPDAFQEWIDVSRAHQAWALRMMIEAFRRDNRMVSFAVHHFIDAFPAGWMKAIVDCERTLKPAYFTCRDALKSQLVSLRGDRWSGFSSEEIDVEVWVCNDTQDPIEGSVVAYQTQMAGRVLECGEIAADMRPVKSICQGALRVRLPDVRERGELEVFAVLKSAAGKSLSFNSFKMQVFPPLQVAERASVVVLDGNGGAVHRLLNELGVAPCKEAAWPADAVIFIGDMGLYEQNRKAVDRHVQAGGTALFYGVPQGCWKIGLHSLQILPCGMNPRVFVSRKTGHPLVDGFSPRDFGWWYSSDVDAIAPLLKFCIAPNSWDSVLSTINPTEGLGEARQWADADAVASVSWGKGKIIVCELKLDHCLMNPAGRLLLERMLQIAPQSEGKSHEVI
jgi:hypothetical protein